MPLKREESFQRMRILNLLPLVETEVPMILVSSRFPEQWSVAMIWFMSVMTMVLI